MANVKISQLPAASAALGTQEFEVNESGTSKKVTGAQIATYVISTDAGLQSIANLTTVADRMIYTTAADTYAVTTLTAAGRAILDDADASAQRTTLGLAIGTDVQAYDADLAALAALASNGMIARTGAGTVAARTITAGTGISVTNGDGVSGNPTISAVTQPVMILTNEQSSTSGGGGTATSGSWETRVLNTEIVNTISGASLSSNQIVLPAGTYRFFSQESVYRVGNAIGKLRQVSGTAADIIIGTVAFSNSSATHGGISQIISGQFTITGSTTYEIQHRVEATRATDGYGPATTTALDGTAKRFGIVVIEKVA